MSVITKSPQTLDLDGQDFEACCYRVEDLSTVVCVPKSFEAELESGSVRQDRLALPQDIFTLTRLLPNDQFLQQVILLPESTSGGTGTIECQASLYRFVCRGIDWNTRTQTRFNQAWCSLLRHCTPFQAAFYDLCRLVETEDRRQPPEMDFATEVCRYFLSGDYVEMAPFLDSKPLKSMAIMTSLSRATERLSRRLDRQANLAKVLSDVEQQHQSHFDRTVLTLFDRAQGTERSTLAKILVYGGSEVSLEKLRDVSSLNFSGQAFDDVLVRKLKFLEGIANLDLSYTAVTSDAAQHLRWLPHLQELSLAGTRLHNYALAHIARCAGLLRLDLSGTQIGDEGLAALGALKRLQQLNLQGTNVTEAGRAELKRMLPFCRLQ